MLFIACMTTNEAPLSGSCTVDDTLTAGCNVTPDGGAASLGLTGYRCAGTGHAPT